ncbi:DoxX family protein [Sinorhizobium sp. RAC02]|uniref:DoxX family protein n=1 Tax=Sinorhizobium sp. RAC02 TaxID=1842534 RepID=UPI00083D1128|nr:DoxX family protein [Sinorhizobium sp. RAC02]
MLFSTKQFAPYLLSVMRMVSALVLFSYGTQKIIGFPADDGGPPPGSLPWIAGLLELVLGFSLLVGFKIRLSAFILSGLMAFAYFLRHAPQGFYPAQNGGTAAILFCFVFLYLASAGGGPLSLDAVRIKSRV